MNVTTSDKKRVCNTVYVNKQDNRKTFKKQLDAIAELAPNDSAFVKRSNGEWQLAVVIETSTSNVHNDKYIKFLFDIHGHTKVIPSNKWMKLIRLVRFPARSSITLDEPQGRSPIETQSSTGPSWHTNSVSLKEHHEQLVQLKRKKSNDAHQQAFISAFTSIGHSPRSAKHIT
jgi:hypothetical protein